MVILFYQTNRVGGYSLEPAGKAELFFGRRLNADPRYIYSAGVGDVFAHLLDVGRELWLLRDNYRVDILDFVVVRL